MLAVLEAILAVLEASWRPSRAILEDFLRTSTSMAILPGGRRIGPKPTGEFLKNHQNLSKPKSSSTPCTPVLKQQGAADLMAFGQIRHRAWVIGQRRHECWL